MSATATVALVTIMACKDIASKWHCLRENPWRSAYTVSLDKQFLAKYSKKHHRKV